MDVDECGCASPAELVEGGVGASCCSYLDFDVPVRVVIEVSCTTYADLIIGCEDDDVRA